MWKRSLQCQTVDELAHRTNGIRSFMLDSITNIAKQLRVSCNSFSQ